MPQTMVAILNRETISIPCLGTLDPWGGLITNKSINLRADHVSLTQLLAIRQKYVK